MLILFHSNKSYYGHLPLKWKIKHSTYNELILPVFNIGIKHTYNFKEALDTQLNGKYTNRWLWVKTISKTHGKTNKSKKVKQNKSKQMYKEVQIWGSADRLQSAKRCVYFYCVPKINLTS